MRQGNCYLSVYQAADGGALVCETPTSQLITKKQCCCSIGFGWSYGQESCEPCPRPNTPEYLTLCVGPGQIVDPNGRPTGNYIAHCVLTAWTFGRQLSVCDVDWRATSSRRH